MTPKRPARILIIDDEQELCLLLSEYLKTKGYETSVAYDGPDGLEKLQASRYELVLSDLKMPKMSGLETIEQIKRLDPRTEVVFLTAYGSVPTAIEALRLGAYDFIEKPVKLERLLKVIEGALDRLELKTVKGFEATTRAVFSTVKLSELLPLLSDIALTVAPAEDAFVALQLGDRFELAGFSSIGEAPSQASRLQAALAVSKLAERGRCFTAAPAADARFSSVKAEPPLRFLLAYPMWAQDEFLGVLGLCRTRGEDAFSAAETHNFSLFAALVTEAVRSARLYADLERKMEELKTAERRAVQSEKMAALGRIISGLAHELKNPLAGILLNAEMLGKKADGTETGQIAADIESAANRCNGIIENLLTYSRAARTDRAACDVASLLDSAESQLRGTPSGARCRVVRKLDRVPEVLVNAVQLEQVFRNLLHNAMQAMPEGGEVTVSLRTLRAEREALQRWAAPGAAAVVRSLDDLARQEGELWDVVEVRDQGVGIAPEDLPQLFEPFFTTKAPGEGTGLGLYLSYEIVSANGGALWVSSPGLGKGTSFFVALPAASSSLSPLTGKQEGLLKEKV